MNVSRQCLRQQAPECQERNGWWIKADFDRRDDGLHCYCKSCRRLMARLWKKAHRTEMTAYLNEWKARHPGRTQELRRNWYSNNRNREKAKTAAWKRANPVLHRGYQRLRVAAVKGHWLRDSEWAEVIQAYGCKCLRCGSPEHITVDHIIPLKKGGTDTKENVQPLCLRCNCWKKIQIIDYRPDMGLRWLRLIVTRHFRDVITPRLLFNFTLLP